MIYKRHILQIQIWIKFLAPCVGNMKKNIITKIYSQIYLNLGIYIWILENNQIPGYCQLDIKTFFHADKKVKYLKIFFYYDWYFGV